MVSPDAASTGRHEEGERVFRTQFLCLVGAALTALALAAPAFGDVKITDRQYVRHDGGQDATTLACSTNNRQQNEPTAAVSPTQPAKMTAGANDYCTTPTNGDAWAGFYFSSDSGATWTNSLLPGYPLDTTAEGRGVTAPGARPRCRRPGAGLGPVRQRLLRRDRQRRPANGSIWVARYSWLAGAMPDYQGTAIVARGTPSPIFLGLFNDKVMIEVDRSENAATSGNVYVCWALFTASGANNGVFFSRSTDGGRTFSNRMKISDSIHGNQSCDIGVGSTGRVWVAWRQFEVQAAGGCARRLLDRRRPLVHEARSRLSSSAGTWATRPVTPVRSAGRATRRALVETARWDAARPRPASEHARLRRRAVRVSFRLRVRAGRFERAHLRRSDARGRPGCCLRARGRDGAGHRDSDRDELLDDHRRCR